MKVLFLWNGMTHYFNLITSAINNHPDVEVLYITPASVSESIGEGVFQTDKGVAFNYLRIEEKNSDKYGLYFEGLDGVIQKFQPDIIMVSEIHIKSLMFDSLLNDLVKKNGIKIILRSIPFGVEKKDVYLQNAKEKVKGLQLPTFQSMPFVLRKIFRSIGFHKLYAFLYTKPRALQQYKKQAALRSQIYSFADAHVNYIEDAYSILGSYGVSKDKIFITYNSPDTDHYFSVKAKIEKDPPVLPHSRYRIVHLSRLVAWKRVDMLIQALSDIRPAYPEAELLIIGNGPETESLKTLAVDLQVEDAVKFLGGIYDTEVLGKYLIASSVYVLAGMGGLSINDAMCFGLPVICSVCDGTEKYLVREGYNGLYFENGNQESLNEKIRMLFDDESLREQMGHRSFQIIANEINIHTVVKGYVRAFKYVTGILDTGQTIEKAAI